MKSTEKVYADCVSVGESILKATGRTEFTQYDLKRAAVLACVNVADAYPLGNLRALTEQHVEQRLSLQVKLSTPKVVSPADVVEFQEAAHAGDIVRMVNGRALRLDVTKLLRNIPAAHLAAFIVDEDEERAAKKLAFQTVQPSSEGV